MGMQIYLWYDRKSFFFLFWEWHILATLLLQWFSQWLPKCAFPPKLRKSPLSPHPQQHLVLFVFSVVATLAEVIQVVEVVLIHIFLIAKGIVHLKRYLLAIVSLFLRSIFFSVHSDWLTDGFVSLVFNFCIPTYFLDTDSLSGRQLENIFFHVIGKTALSFAVWK